MAPANTANLTRTTTTDRKTPPRLHQFAPGARHQTDVVFPPERDSGGFIFGLTFWPAGKTHVLRQRLSFELGEDGTWF